MQQTYTAMSQEGVQAVKDTQRYAQRGIYEITTAGPWTQDFGTLRTALMDFQEEAGVAEDLLEELHGTNSLLLLGEGFDVLVDALVARWDTHGDEQAASFLSGIAETLGIEFI
jgi:hypothetical protein